MTLIDKLNKLKGYRNLTKTEREELINVINILNNRFGN